MIDPPRIASLRVNIKYSIFVIRKRKLSASKVCAIRSKFQAISKRLKRFRIFECYFWKQLTIEVIWPKHEEIWNFRDFHLIRGIYRNWLLIQNVFLPKREN